MYARLNLAQNELAERCPNSTSQKRMRKRKERKEMPQPVKNVMKQSTIRLFHKLKLNYQEVYETIFFLSSILNTYIVVAADSNLFRQHKGV